MRMYTGLHPERTPGKRAAGVTLIELLTVIVVVAILSVIAVASYRAYLIRANRSEGRDQLLRVETAEEKYFVQNDTYTTDIINPPPAGLGFGSATTPNGFYTLAIAPGATGNIATSYQATATAQAGQTHDSATCQVFSITDQGQRTPDDASGCWK
jgi:type IV pilus assembly protein PilE